MTHYQVGDFVVSTNSPHRGVIVSIEIEAGQQFCTVRATNGNKWYAYASDIEISAIGDPIGVYRIGDRVQPNDHSGRMGEIIEVHADGRVKVKWDGKTSRQSRLTTVVRPSALKMCKEAQS